MKYLNLHSHKRTKDKIKKLIPGGCLDPNKLIYSIISGSKEKPQLKDNTRTNGNFISIKVEKH